MSNDTSDNVELLQEEAVVMTTAAVALSVVAITSNGLLIYVVLRSAALRTSTNFFIASLSGGEFLTGIFVIPFASTTASSGAWAFSSGLCRFVGLMGIMGPCVSALSLLVVSADRFLAISRPLRYASMVTKMSTALIIVLVWALSLLLSLLPLGHWGMYCYSNHFKMCLMRSTAGKERVPEVVVKEIICTFFPVALVVVIVLKTVCHIRGHRRVFAFVPVLVTATSLPSGTRAMATNSSRGKATRTLLLVSVAFVAFCVPSAVASIMCHRPSSCHLVGARALRALLWLSFLSCVVNPIIIMTLNSKFRIKLKTLFCRRGAGRAAFGRCCGLWKPAKGDKEPFTVSSGLQAVLEASLLLNVMHGTGQQDAKQRRHVIMTEQARWAEQAELAGQSLMHAWRPAPGIMTLRKTRSTPDCRLAALMAAGGSGV